MDDITIRSMTKDDLNQSLDLWRVSFNAGFSSGFDSIEILTRYIARNPDFSTVACLNSGKIIGALMCGHDGRRGSIYHTAVFEEHRKKGIGRMMEERSISELKKIGILTGFLFININNPGSQEFWTNIGWTVIDDIKYLYKEF